MTSRSLVRHAVIIALFLALAVASDARAQSGAERVPPEHPLVGEWRALRVEVGGQEIDVPGMPKPEITFRSDGSARGSEAMAATWRSDDTLSPHRLDLVHTAGRDAGQAQHCTYEVAGDRLTVVFNIPGAGPETGAERLDSMHKPNLMLMVFERIRRRDDR